MQVENRVIEISKFITIFHLSKVPTKFYHGFARISTAVGEFYGEKSNRAFTRSSSVRIPRYSQKIKFAECLDESKTRN